MTTPNPMTIVQAVKSAGPVSTHAVGLSIGSIPQWIMTGVMTLVAGCLTFLPRWQRSKTDQYKAESDRAKEELTEERAGAAELLIERRKDIESMRADIKELRALVTDAVQTANAAETRSAILRGVVSMLTAEVQRTDPNNPVLQQAQAMIRDASSGDHGVGRGLQDIAAKVSKLD